jgi:hypothetical protein
MPEPLRSIAWYVGAFVAIAAFAEFDRRILDSLKHIVGSLKNIEDKLDAIAAEEQERR